MTWYDADGQRIELSGATLDNWATKTANLLLEEADAAPGTRIALDLPLHWRTVCWTIGAWRTGACVVTTPDTTTATDVLVTTHPTPRPGLQVAVALPPLARAFDAPLHGALDAAATLLAHPDTLGPVLPPAPHDPALSDPTTTLDYQTLTDRPQPAPQRVLRTLDPETPVHLTDLLALDVLAAGGSLVLVTTTHEAATPGPARDHLIATERITHP